jgi:uncharacterized membrane protein HdeD (DUF308 family)
MHRNRSQVAFVMEEPSEHDQTESKLWLPLVLRGLVALVFSIVALSSVRVPIGRLSVLFATYALADGFLGLYAGRGFRTHKRRRLLGVDGIASVIAAVIVLAFPVASALQIAGGIRAVIGGACDATWSLSRRASDYQMMTGLGGISGVALGIVLLGWPGPAIVALPWLLGLGAFVSGSLLVGGAITQVRREPETRTV